MPELIRGVTNERIKSCSSSSNLPATVPSVKNTSLHRLRLRLGKIRRPSTKLSLTKAHRCLQLWSWWTMGSLKCNRSRCKHTSLLSSLCLRLLSIQLQYSFLQLPNPRPSCLWLTLRWQMQLPSCLLHQQSQHTTSRSNQTINHLTSSLRVATAPSSLASLRPIVHSQSPTNQYPNSSTCRLASFLMLAQTRRLVATKLKRNSEWSELFRAFQHSASQRILRAPYF